MDLSRLKTELEQIIEETNIPGVSFFEVLSNVGPAGQWETLTTRFGNADFTRRLREIYETDPSRFIKNAEALALECKRIFLSNSRSKLTSLSRLTFSPGENLSLVEQWQRAFDSSGQMLRLAFAEELLDLIEPAARRAEKLKELMVTEASSPEADKYLSEACFSYYYGLYTACVVLCRSVVEEALERKLDPGLLDRWRESKDKKLTLGNLIHKIKIHEIKNYKPQIAFFTEEVKSLADKVNKAGVDAAHTATATEDDAANCMKNARELLLILLGTPRATVS